MKGNPKVIASLNEALKEELTAINQYFLHAEMCENWHYHKLADFIKKHNLNGVDIDWEYPGVSGFFSCTNLRQFAEED